MTLASCLNGPAFSITGNTQYIDNSVDFEVNFDSAADALSVKAYEWYIDGKLMLDNNKSSLEGSLTCGSHILGVRILTENGWSGVRYLNFQTCGMPAFSIIGPASVREGSTAEFKLQATFADGSVEDWTTQSAFTSSEGTFSGAILTTSSNRTNNDSRNITITAYRNNVSVASKLVDLIDSTSITLSSIDITGPETVNEGSTAQFKVVASYSNGTSEDLTTQYQLSSTEGNFSANVLSVLVSNVVNTNREAKITAVKSGADTLTRVITIIDSSPAISTISIVGADSINEGSTSNYIVQAIYLDGSSKDVSSEYTFTSTEGTFAGTTLTIPGNSLISANRSANIVARKAGFPVLSKTITIVDTSPSIVSTTITGADSINEGSTELYRVLVSFSDGTTQDVTSQYIFSCNEGVITGNSISIPTNNVSGDGRQITLTAQKSGSPAINKQITVVDTTPVISVVTIEGQDSIYEGVYVAYMVVATLSNGSKQNLTSQYAFTSSEGSFNGNSLLIPKNSISNDNRNITITATKIGATSTVTKQVAVQDTTPVVVSTYISGAETLNEGTSSSFNVVYKYSDGTTKDFTNQYIFSSSEGSFTGNVLSISNNSINNDNRTIIITAQKTGSPNIVKNVAIKDKSPIITALSLVGPDSILEGESASFEIVATYSDGSTQNQTNNYTFTSPEGTFNGKILSIPTGINTNPRNISITALKNGTVVKTKSIAVKVISIAGAVSIEEGGSVTFNIIATAPGGTTEDLTGSYTFNSSEGTFLNNVLSIPVNSTLNDGRSITVSALKNAFVIKTKTVTVIDKSPLINISGPNSILEGDSASFEIVATYSDGSTQNQTSSYTFTSSEGTFNGNLLSIPVGVNTSPRNISVTAMKNGTVAKTKSVAVKVISITGAASIAEGASTTFNIIATAPDGTTEDLTASYTFTSSEGTFLNNVLSIPVNSTVNDGRNITISALKNGVVIKTKTITVVDNSPVIAISGPLSIDEGAFGIYEVIASYPSGTIQNVTSEYNFVSTEGSFVGNQLSIPANSGSNDGRSITISAIKNGQTIVTKTISINDKSLIIQLVYIDGPNNLIEGSSATFKVMEKYSNETTQDQTNSYTLTSDSGTFNGNALSIPVDESNETPPVTIVAKKGGVEKARKQVNITDTTPAGVFTVDLFDNANLNVIAHIYLPEVSLPAAYTGNNVVPVNSIVANAYIIASDLIDVANNRLKWRFEFNIRKLLIDYPQQTQLVFFISGRSNNAGEIGVAYSLKNYTAEMALSGSQGAFIPGTNNAHIIGGGSVKTFYSFVEGGRIAGNYSLTSLHTIVKFVYDVGTREITVIDYYALS